MSHVPTEPTRPDFAEPPVGQAPAASPAGGVSAPDAASTVAVNPPVDAAATTSATSPGSPDCPTYSTIPQERQSSSGEGPLGGDPAHPGGKGERPPLVGAHVQMLLSSSIGVGQVGQRGYRTVTSRAELGRLGFSEPQRCVPALLIPLWGVHGESVGYQIRPDRPRQGKDGKLVKYETPAKSHMVLDVPPSARPMLGDPSKPLFITEGVKKADSAATRDLCCVALLGVWNWRGRNDLGGTLALPEWDSIALNRTIYIVFDSDVVTKSGVHLAMSRLKAYLEHRKATVKVVYLPSGEGGTKVGLDDFFFAGHSVDDLLSHASDEVRPVEADPHATEAPYKITPEGIFLRSDSGSMALTNFGARIVADVVHDDGAEERRSFRIEGQHQGRTTIFDVPAAEFGDLDWV